MPPARPTIDPRWADLIAAGQIRFAVFPPQYGKDADGALIGPWIEVMRALAIHVGVPATFAELANPDRLVESLAAEWHPAKYTDEYRDNLMRIIKAKAKGKPLPVEEVEDRENTKVLDLVSRLQQSLEASTKRGAKKKSAAKKRTSKKGAAKKTTRRRKSA